MLKTQRLEMVREDFGSLTAVDGALTAAQLEALARVPIELLVVIISLCDLHQHREAVNHKILPESLQDLDLP